MMSNYKKYLVFFLLGLVVSTGNTQDLLQYSIAQAQQILDSIYIAQWDQGDSFKVKGLSHQLMSLTKEAMSEQYDSTLYSLYLDGMYWTGAINTRLGFFDEGQMYLDSAYNLTLRKFGKEHQHLSYTSQALAGIYLQKGDIDKALYWIKEHIRADMIVKYVFVDSADISKLYYNLALVYDQGGRPDLAIPEYNKAIEVREQFGLTFETIRPLDAIGLIYLNKDQPHKALPYFSKIYNIIKDQVPATAEVPHKYAALRMTTVYVAMNKDSLANEYLKQALPLPPITKLHSRQYLTILNTLSALGDAYLKSGDFSKAKQFLEEVIIIAQHYEGAKSKYVIENKGKIAETWLGENRPDSAIVIIQQQFKLLQPGIDLDNYPERVMDISLGIGFLLPTTLGQYGHAWRLKFQQNNQLTMLNRSLQFYNYSSKSIDALRRDFYTPGSKQILISRAIALYEGAVETALKLYEVTNDHQYLETAFSFAEKSKSVLLLESLQGSKAQTFTGVPSHLIDREKELKIDLAFYSKQLYDEQNKKQPKQEKIQRWESHSLQLRHEYDSLITVFQQQYPDYYQLKYDIQYATVEEIREYLPNEEAACIEYFWGKENLYAFLITKTQVNCIRKPLSEDMDSHLEAFSKLLNRPDLGSPGEYAEHAGYLYDYLLANALNDTEVDHLIIIPDGRLGYLPFQVLIDNRKLEGVDDYRKLPYVINNYEVRYEYSSTLLLAEASPRQQQGGFLGFAPSYGDGDSGISVRSGSGEGFALDAEESTMIQLASLHYTQTEVQDINNLFTGKSHTGNLATESSFKKEAPKHQVLHLAMHAHTNDENPMYSRLIFQQDVDEQEDGMLHVYELYNMDLQADLAVLSACDTGTGKLHHGEGIMSLSRAFKYAGCPNIVMSLWQADDASTKDIMVHFYENLKKGKGKSEALRDAKLEYFKTAGKEKSHPFYWATFVLVGDDKPVKLK